MWNVALVTLLILLSNFTSFAVDASAPADRLSVSVTLLLTAVAFKFVVSSSLPKIPYLTLMDKYVLWSLILQCFVVLQNAISVIFARRTEISDYFDYGSMVLLLVAVLTLNVYFIGKVLREPESRYSQRLYFNERSEDEDDAVRTSDSLRMPTVATSIMPVQESSFRMPTVPSLESSFRMPTVPSPVSSLRMPTIPRPPSATVPLNQEEGDDFADHFQQMLTVPEEEKIPMAEERQSPTLPLPNLNNYLPLKHDSDRNEEANRVYRKYNNEPGQIIIWMKNYFSDVVLSRLKDRLKNYKQDSDFTLRMLGIGSGNGETELKVILELLKVFPQLEVTVVEPSKEGIESYMTLTETTKEEYTGVTWNWRQETLQDFINNNETKFHFISLIHTMYFSPLSELQGHLETIYNLLEDKGLIFSMHDTATTCLSRLDSIFSEVKHPLRPPIHSGHIIDVWKKMGISHEVVSIIEATIEVTECFKQRSEDGSCLLDFLLQILNFVKHSSQKEVQAILDLLQRENLVVAKEGRLYVDHSAEVTVIVK